MNQSAKKKRESAHEPEPKAGRAVCPCTPDQLWRGECLHRPLYRQRATLIRHCFFNGVHVEPAIARIREWQRDRAQVASQRDHYRDPARDVLRLYHRLAQQDRLKFEAERRTKPRLTVADCEKILTLGAQSRVKRKLAFATFLFRLLAHWRSLKISTSAKQARMTSLPLSRRFLRQHLSVNWRTHRNYVSEAIRLGVIRLACRYAKNRCREFQVLFKLEKPKLNGLYLVPTVEVESFEEFIRHKLTSGTSLRELIHLLGDSRQIRRISERVQREP